MATLSKAGNELASMKPITISEIKNIAEYEKIRSEFRARIIEIKNRRRVSVGPKITFVFENRDTVLSQIQEMMRAERIVHDDKIQHEIDVYNQLLPGPNELSATMFIEITQNDQIKPELDKLLGLTRNDYVSIVVGEERIPARFEEGHEEDDKVSAVQYVRFQFSESGKKLFLSGTASVSVEITHPNYKEKTDIPKHILESLAADFE
jgi:hypothetical protein